MASSETIETPPICVSATSYLIEKIINDASKAMRSTITHASTTNDASAAGAEAMIGVIAGDDEFTPSNASAEFVASDKLTNAKTTTTAEKPANKLTITVTNTPAPVTLPKVVDASTVSQDIYQDIYQQQQQSEQQQWQQQAKQQQYNPHQSSVAEMSRAENKYSPKELSSVSYRRAVEPTRTFVDEVDESLSTPSPNLKQFTSEGLNTSERRILNVTERNRRLKRAFLSNIPDEASLKGFCMPSGDAQLKDYCIKERENFKPDQKLNFLESQTKTYVVLQNTDKSFVTQRIEQLQRKFEENPQQQRQYRAAHFPSVTQLRHKFDKAVNEVVIVKEEGKAKEVEKPKEVGKEDKMFVNDNKLTDAASPEATTMLAIKSVAAVQRQSPLSDEGCNLGHSPYSSDEDNDDNASICTASTTVERKRNKDKVARSASSDSALGLDVDESIQENNSNELASRQEQQQQPQQTSQRRMTLTVTDLPLRPALLPLAEPTALPDSPPHIAAAATELHSAATLSDMIAQSTVPSKVLLEERLIEIHEDAARSYNNNNNIVNNNNNDSACSSRRESAQSCLSDYYPNSECGGVRFVRTPSVVVSDYSDEIMCGITLEEIEYFRAQRMRRRRSSLDTASCTERDANGCGAGSCSGSAHSDVSASSSCSNLYYCGSTISALDGAECYVNGARIPLAATQRKSSACSMCSATGGEDEDTTSAAFGIAEQSNEEEEVGEEDVDAEMKEKSTMTAIATPQQQQDLCDLLAAQQLSTKHPKKPSGWRKIRNIVQWTPFFQTYKKQRYPWVQLAGHQGNFKAGPEQGTVLKKLCAKEEDCFRVLMQDVLRPYVPEYKGQVTSEDGDSVYLQLQDLLSDFSQPCVMDCKIGVRTYLEEELSKAKEKPKLRKDMYEKMIQIDPNAPNEEEHKAKGVTKPRYMVWRETISSTATLGFRIEGIKRSDGTSSKDFKTTKSKEQIKLAFRDFINGAPHSLPRYIQRLRAIRATLECSDFFRTHEVIGSSLLFVHDRIKAGVWLIDFAKTVSLPANQEIDHNTIWKVGNHEDGYLIGINNLIDLFGELETELAESSGESNNSPPQHSSSNSSTASMSPRQRNVSESNYDEMSGAVGGGGGGGGGDQLDMAAPSSEHSSYVTLQQNVEPQKLERPEKDEVERMEKTLA